MNRRTAAFIWFALTGISARAAVLYDFESGTQGWTNDTSVYYNGNFGAPSTAASPVHGGVKGLSVPMDFTDKALGNILNDAVYVQPGGLNLSASAGVTLYVFVGQGTGNGNPAYPLYGTVYVKTGATWAFKEADAVSLRRNQWYKLTINFAAKGVANTNDVREIGVHVYGGDFDKGTAVLTVDSVQSGLGDDLTAPAAPTGLTASDAGSGNRVSLSWSASGASDLGHYNVYRANVSGSLATKKLVTVVPAGETTVADISVVDGLSCYYNVTAVDKSGNESPASNEGSAVASGPTALSFPKKGMTYASWEVSQWLGLDSDSSLDDLRGTGANYVAVVVTQYMANGTANTIARDIAKTASDAAVVAAIQDIHSRGMKVMLKPHVDVTGGLWRGSITPSNPATWFTSYQAFINGYATLAQTNGVEMFCVGTELKTMTQGRTAEWTTVITGVKSRFSGTGGLTYSANANLPNDEFAAVGFWDQLDFIGVNLYFPLTAVSNPSLDQIKAAWGKSKDDFNMLQTLSDFRAVIGKDILVTEIGYQSANGTNVTPYGVSGTFDPQEQKLCYEAAFAALNNRTWINGLFWWSWDPNPNVDGYSDTGYAPQNKSALDLLVSKYGGEATRSFYNFETGVSGWVADTTTDFADNFGPPGTENQGGSNALRYALDLNKKVGGIIKDFGYVEPALPKDLSGYKGIKASVMIPAGASIPGSAPATVAFIIQSSSSYRWYQSNTFRNLVPGQWREVSLDFASANRYIGSVSSPGIPVENLNDVRRIGVMLTGAGSASGSTIFYVDNVRAIGEGVVMGVSVGPSDYNLGEVSPQGSSVGGTPLLIENSGNVTSRYKLACSVSVPAGWIPVSSAPDTKNFNLNGRFNSALPSSFSPADHAILPTPATSDAVRFAGDERGDNVAAGDFRSLWLEFRAPQIADLNDTLVQTITLAVTTEAQ
ncbi:MAG: hypothetical protein IPN90_12710 [Elusimicrobia bacterium]|nr:hypothetical protein [Elusimicrobiota bacterium]